MVNRRKHTCLSREVTSEERVQVYLSSFFSDRVAKFLFCIFFSRSQIVWKCLRFLTNFSRYRRVVDCASSKSAKVVSLEFGAFAAFNHATTTSKPLLVSVLNNLENPIKMMAVAAAQKNREMFAIKKSYSIEVSTCQICLFHPLPTPNFQLIYQSNQRLSGVERLCYFRELEKF